MCCLTTLGMTTETSANVSPLSICAPNDPTNDLEHKVKGTPYIVGYLNSLLLNSFRLALRSTFFKLQAILTLNDPQIVKTTRPKVPHMCYL